ncbi:efflux transporter periplasmic adaptor subunit [Myxococcus xanthus]|uniref:Efflux transporter periplasmic adaptor subunit n=2 Tax=Myxococcus xanthus TaxID=34 RepID=A0AAE6KS86_MYXXA|nr:efflux transporter periplasmic adaptor subunit [Myxococcus xanthus]QDE75339.1 efflux transporter periplasmic adaptor subunit [Myxococcus xanthus]QDE82644.1 efflux transporter periplasmic adaptor subunit [Myxococcus xanthus]QDE96914.1 efflux transporter periplasmic adaptor subunit [Myxococcus xanthus]QDF04446.1 efflux transporter periplasmic adaptor subunit [Myxococcus xanthus]
MTGRSRTTVIRRMWMAAAMAAVVTTGCGKASNKPALPEQTGPAALGVRAITPATELSGDVTRVTGQIRSKNEAVLGPQATGTISKMNVRVGDKVKKGQVLAVLDASNVAISVEQARAVKQAADAALELATSSLERTRKVAESGGVAAAGLDQAVIGQKQAAAQAAQAAAGLRLAEEMLRDHSITAPFDGVITARTKNIGDSVAVTPSTPVFSIVDTTGLEVRAQVPESVVDKVRVGSKTHGTVSPSGARFDVQVSVVGAVVDATNRTVEVLADVVGEPSTALRPGALVELDFSTVGEADDKGLFLPTQAVSARGQEGFVWVVQDGTVRKRDVRVERVLPGYVRILQGLGADERVLADSSLDVKEGTAVRVVQ